MAEGGGPPATQGVVVLPQLLRYLNLNAAPNLIRTQNGGPLVPCYQYAKGDSRTSSFTCSVIVRLSSCAHAGVSIREIGRLSHFSLAYSKEM